MPANVSFSAPLPSSLPPAAPPAPGPGNPAFAQMLSQHQADAARPETAPPAESKAPKADAEKESADKPADAVAEKAATKPPKPADKAARGEKPAVGGPATGAVHGNAATTGELASDVAATEAQATADDAAADPVLTDWMASLNRPAPAVVAEPASTGASGAAQTLPTDDAKTAATGAGRLGRSASGADDGKAAGAAPGILATAAAGNGAREAAEPSGAGFVAELSSRLNEPAAALRMDATPSAGPAGLAPSAPPSGGNTASATPSVAVPTPATSPEFPQALGVQLSVLAKQGVQQAELHLNPAEMGPIAVQIAMDGSKAQIDFAASSAATRQIIENGLPELASALREAGLTLTGGGVFQQPRQQPQGDGSAGSGTPHGRGPDGGAATDAPAAEVRRSVRVAAGGVDLYA